MRLMNVSRVKANLCKLVKAFDGAEPIAITNHGQVVAYLISTADVEKNRRRRRK